MAMKKSLFLLSLLNLGFISVQAQLNQHQWENRILLLFTETSEDSLLIQQITHLEEDGLGLEDRDLVICQIYKSTGIAPNGKLLFAREVDQLRTEYKVSDSDSITILIGKDGGEKLRKTNKLLLREVLYQTIDSMPMRRAEMRKKKQN